MVKPNKQQLIVWCENGIIFAFCALIFFLPISIALVESFSGLAIFLFIVKKLITASLSVDEAILSTNKNINKQELFWRFFRRSLIEKKHPLRVQIFLLIVAVFLSVLFSSDRILSFIAFIGKFLQSLLLMLSFQEGFKKKSHIVYFLGFLIASSLLISISGMVQYFYGVDFIRQNVLSNDGRVSASLRHANDLGAYLLVAFSFILGCLLSHFSKFNTVLKVLLIGIMMTVAVVLMLTFSRSAWLGLIGFLCVLFFLQKNSRLLVAVLFLVVIFIFLPALKTKRNLYLISDDKAAVNVIHENINELPKKEESFTRNLFLSVKNFGGSGRAEYWEKAIKVIRTAPVFGVGLNTYSKAVSKYPGMWGGGYTHNCYLQMTAEIGLVGISIFIYFLVVLFCFSIKRLFELTDPFLKTMMAVAISVLAGYLLESFFDTTFYSVQLGSLMWIIIGFILAITKMDPKLTKQ